MIMQGESGPGDSSRSTEKYIRRVKINKRRTGKVFRVNTQVAGFQIRDTMLDLGSDVNILPQKTWEALGKPKLTYSTIHLRMENQYYIVPIGKMEEF